VKQGEEQGLWKYKKSGPIKNEERSENENND